MDKKTKPDHIESKSWLKNSVEVFTIPALIPDEEKIEEIFSDKESKDSSYLYDVPGFADVSIDKKEQELINSKLMKKFLTTIKFNQLTDLWSWEWANTFSQLQHIPDEFKKDMVVTFVDSSSAATDIAKTKLHSLYPKKFKDIKSINGDLSSVQNEISWYEKKLVTFRGKTIGNMNKSQLDKLLKWLLTKKWDILMFSYFTAPKNEEEINNHIKVYDFPQAQERVKRGVKALLAKDTRVKFFVWEEMSSFDAESVVDDHYIINEKTLAQIEKLSAVNLLEDTDSLVDNAEYRVEYDKEKSTIKVGLLFKKSFQLYIPWRPIKKIKWWETQWLHFSKRFSDEWLNQLFKDSDLRLVQKIEGGRGEAIAVIDNSPLMSKKNMKFLSHATFYIMLMNILIGLWIKQQQDSNQQTQIRDLTQSKIQDILSDKKYEEHPEKHWSDSITVLWEYGHVSKIENMIEKLYALNSTIWADKIKLWIIEELQNNSTHYWDLVRIQASSYIHHMARGKAQLVLLPYYIKISKDIIKKHADEITMLWLPTYPYARYSEYFRDMMNSIVQWEKWENNSLEILLEVSPRLAEAKRIFTDFDMSWTRINSSDLLNLVQLVWKNQKNIALFEWEWKETLPLPVDNKVRAEIAKLVYAQKWKIEWLWLLELESDKFKTIVKNTLKSEKEALYTTDPSTYLWKYTSFKSGKIYDTYIWYDEDMNPALYARLYIEGSSDDSSIELWSLALWKEIVVERKELGIVKN